MIFYFDGTGFLLIISNNLILQQEISRNCVIEEKSNHRIDRLVECRCWGSGPVPASVALHRWFRNGRSNQKGPARWPSKLFLDAQYYRVLVLSWFLNVRRTTSNWPRNGEPSFVRAICNTYWRLATGHSWHYATVGTSTRSVRIASSRAPWSSGATIGPEQSTTARITTRPLPGSSPRLVDCTTCIIFGVGVDFVLFKRVKLPVWLFCRLQGLPIAQGNPRVGLEITRLGRMRSLHCAIDSWDALPHSDPDWILTDAIKGASCFLLAQINEWDGFSMRRCQFGSRGERANGGYRWVHPSRC